MKLKTAVAAFLITTVHAGYANQSVEKNNHFYIGADSNYIWIDFKATLTNDNASENITDNESGLTGGFFTGYEWQTTHLTYDIELNYNYDNISHIYEGQNSNCENILNDDLGIELHVGKSLLKNDYSFLILGANLGNFEYKRYNASTGQQAYSNSYSEPGFTLGIGSDYPIKGNYKVHVDYKFSQYNEKDNISGDQGQYDRSGYAKTNKISLGIIRQF